MLKDILNAILRQDVVLMEVESPKILAAADNYAAEDVLSESAAVGTPYTFRGLSGGSSGYGYIEKATVFCSTTALTPRITLYLFSKVPTTNLVDNVGNAAPGVADAPTFQGQIDFPALEDLGGGSTAVVSPSTYGNLPLLVKLENGALYGIAVTRDAITGEAAGMSLNFKMVIRLV